VELELEGVLVGSKDSPGNRMIDIRGRICICDVNETLAVLALYFVFFELLAIHARMAEAGDDRKVKRVDKSSHFANSLLTMTMTDDLDSASRVRSLTHGTRLMR
jgi:hypothetical protein